MTVEVAADDDRYQRCSTSMGKLGLSGVWLSAASPDHPTRLPVTGVGVVAGYHRHRRRKPPSANEFDDDS
jgi:hypothetical protein